jgi:cell wall assembly regulator SMI1
MYESFDLSDFWEKSEYATKEYVDAPVTEELVASVEKELGYKLPRAYVELAMKTQNGGMPKKTCHRTAQSTSWAGDHVALTGIFSIGRKKRHALCGSFGSQFWIDEWEYPAIGVYFADCPSAGHDMLCLDYRECGPTGEPKIVHVDQECDYEITFVAENFASFIRGLEDEAAFEL